MSVIFNIFCEQWHDSLLRENKPDATFPHIEVNVIFP